MESQWLACDFHVFINFDLNDSKATLHQMVDWDMHTQARIRYTKINDNLCYKLSLIEFKWTQPIQSIYQNYNKNKINYESVTEMYLENSYFSENKTLSTKMSLVKGKKTMNEWTNKTAKLSHWMRNTNKPTTYECHGFLVLVDSWRL